MCVYLFIYIYIMIDHLSGDLIAAASRSADCRALANARSDDSAWGLIRLMDMYVHILIYIYIYTHMYLYMYVYICCIYIYI